MSGFAGTNDPAEKIAGGIIGDDSVLVEAQATPRMARLILHAPTH
ncbi:hypothetical protein [Roseomonas sp. WA12]